MSLNLQGYKTIDNIIEKERSIDYLNDIKAAK